MSLVQLSIQQVRNLTQVQFQPCQEINVIFGQNASGKTSLLEAIHILSSARSFRTTHINHVIQHGATKLRVVGQIHNEHRLVPIGIERSMVETRIRINNKNIAQTSKLAVALPVQVINPDIHRILEQGPKYRRQLLDWGVFHVEQMFFPVWQQYNRLLRQRNAALKRSEPEKAIRYWNQALVEQGEVVSRLRAHYVDQLQPFVQGYCARLMEIEPEIHYQRGWNENLTLTEVLNQGLDNDRKQGFTRYGPHRADLSIKHDGIPVQACFSRGQQKLLVSALRLAQIGHLKQQTSQIPVLLVDDLAAELDEQHRTRLLGLLVESGAQLFITVTELALLDTVDRSDVKMFHVEHGAMTEMV